MLRSHIRNIFALLSLAFGVGVGCAVYRVFFLGPQLNQSFEAWSTGLSVIAILGVFIFYKITSRVIGNIVIKHGGKEGDVQMAISFWRFVIIFMTALVILTLYFQLGAVATVFGAFGGMFLGWALQQPVSGFAAWLLISVKRPFRVGDRIQLPSYGLVGDVIDVNAMYTVLNQVGGAVGSEEAVGRDILIPNAMLFGNLIINYTPPPHHNHPNPSVHVKKEIKPEQAYILDEVVVRITFDSDWNEAEKILLNAAREVTGDIINKTKQEPYIRADFYDYGVWLRLRYMTLATDRPRITYEITKKIFEEFSKNELVDFAIPYIYSWQHFRDREKESMICPLCGGKNGNPLPFSRSSMVLNQQNGQFEQIKSTH
ncbi:MAG: mechanosensitive ion channel family protein [Candidatus Bathyarchaeia archaeon]